MRRSPWIPSLLILLFINECQCLCDNNRKDGPYCAEMFNKILKHVSINVKCVTWVALLDGNYFASELSLAPEKRTMVRDYCPITCKYCGTATPASSSSKAPTTKPSASTPPPSSSTTPKPEDLLKDLLQHDPEFKELTKKYNPDKNPKDAIVRYHLLEANRRKVNAHNALYESGHSSYKMGVNHFAVMKPEELAPLALSLPPPAPYNYSFSDIARQKRQASNTTVDFRQYMGPVPNQLDCGGCWAFAMTAALEGFFALKNYTMPTLSVQQLLDCDRAISSEFGVSNLGCGGGYFQVAVEYLKMKGLTSDEAYQFNAQSSGTCQLSSPLVSPKMKTFDTGYIIANSTIFGTLDKALEDRVRKGPVAVGMAVDPDIYSYSEGIYDGTCGKTINHAVVIVGFTSEYWIVRNSWGTSWGENGHMRIFRQAGDPCQLTRYWAQPTAINSVPQGSSGGGNAIIVPTSATTIEPVTQNCCDGECCDWCDCEEVEDDDDYFTTEREEKLLDTTTTRHTTSEMVTTTVGRLTNPPISHPTKNPAKMTKRNRRWKMPQNGHYRN